MLSFEKPHRASDSDRYTHPQPGLHSEFQDSQGYVERPCLKKRNNNKLKLHIQKIWALELNLRWPGLTSSRLKDKDYPTSLAPGTTP